MLYVDSQTNQLSGGESADSARISSLSYFSIGWKEGGGGNPPGLEKME